MDFLCDSVLPQLSQVICVFTATRKALLLPVCQVKAVKVNKMFFWHSFHVPTSGFRTTYFTSFCSDYIPVQFEFLFNIKIEAKTVGFGEWNLNAIGAKNKIVT